MSRSMWILLALFAVMSITMIYLETTGGVDRPWVKCKENLLTQVVWGECTPRTPTGILRDSSGGGETDATPAGDPAANDDGFDRVNRGN